MVDTIKWAWVLCGWCIQKSLSKKSNKSSTSFALSFNIPPRKLFEWFRRLQLWATGDWQLHHNNTPAHASYLMQNFLAKHQTIQVTQPFYSPDLASCDFWLFPKLKSSLKGNRCQTIDEIQENTTGQLMVIGGTVWGSKVSIFEGDWGIIVLCTILFVYCSFFNKCLDFLYYMAGQTSCILHFQDKS